MPLILIGKFDHECGFPVFGYDIDRRKTLGLNPITAFNEWSQVPSCNVYVVCVNTGWKDWKPDMSNVFDVCQKIKIFDPDEQIAHPQTLDFSRLSLAQRLKTLSDSGVKILVCNGISLFLQACLQANSIMVLKDKFGSEEEILKSIKNQDLIKQSKENRSCRSPEEIF